MRQGRRREGGFFRSHRLLHCCGRRLLLPRRGEGVRPPQPHFMVCLPSFYFWSCFPFFCCNEACLLPLLPLLRCKRRASWKKRPFLLVYSFPPFAISHCCTLSFLTPSPPPPKNLSPLGLNPPLHKGTVSLPPSDETASKPLPSNNGLCARGGGEEEGRGAAVAKVRKTPFRTTFFGPGLFFNFPSFPPFSSPPPPSDRFLPPA